jgi:biotin transport system substrate-specific component
MSTYSHPAPAAVLSDLVVARWVREVVLVALGAGLVGVAAQVAVPVPGTPVPVTGQTFAVLVVGAALGTRRAAASLLLYLVAGVAGLGWFADGKSGAGGATFGYVVGFVLAAAVVGWLASRGGDRTALRTAATMTLGTLVIYLVGVPWLAWQLDVGIAEAVRLGMRPFLLGDALKIALAAGVLPLAWLGVRRMERD